MNASGWKDNPPCTELEWREFLDTWASLLIDPTLATGQIAEAWNWAEFGSPGASEKHIAACEARLGLRLPASYRQFLVVSNGWRTGDTTPSLFLPVEQVDWFISRHREWVEDWLKVTADLGEASNPKLPAYHLPYTLQISDVDDATVCLLNPRVQGPAGEWEAWFFGDWVAGADEYPSFGALMVARLETILYVRRRRS